MLAAQRHHAKPPSPEVDEEISGESYFSDSTSTSSILSNHPPSPSPTPKYPKQNNLDGLQQDDSIPTVAKPAFRIPHIFVSKSSDWRKVAPIIFKNASVSP